MKAPGLKTGSGTLGRFKRPRPIVTLTLRDSGYSPGMSLYTDRVANWVCMSAREARQLAARLLKAASRAERGR